MAKFGHDEAGRWGYSDRLLFRQVSREMMRAGLWRRIETSDMRRSGFVRIVVAGRAMPLYELGRCGDGRYVLIERGGAQVEFHENLAAALTVIAYVPPDRASGSEP